ncbi:MAG: hypothetical protein ABIH19_02315 [Candidatus Omnitrophota bacterium]
MKKDVLLLFLLFCFLFYFSTAKCHAAGGEGVNFNKEAAYNIYYEVSDYEVNQVENIRILGTEEIGQVIFLKIKYSGVTEREGFIRLDSIKAILPTTAERPERSFDNRRSY